MTRSQSRIIVYCRTTAEILIALPYSSEHGTVEGFTLISCEINSLKPVNYYDGKLKRQLPSYKEVNTSIIIINLYVGKFIFWQLIYRAIFLPEILRRDSHQTLNSKYQDYFNYQV